MCADIIPSSDDTHFKAFNISNGSADHTDSMVLSPKVKTWKDKCAPDNLKAIDYYVTTLIGALVCNSMDNEWKAHDSAACCPTVVPHLDRETLIIMAPGKADKADPKAIGK